MDGDSDVNTHDNNARPRSISILSSIFRRTISLSESSADEAVRYQTGRRRTVSESSLDDDVPSRQRSATIGDISNTESLPRSGSLRFPAPLLIGTHGGIQQHPEDNIDSGLYIPPITTGKGEQNLNQNGHILPNENLTQQDHLNKRLLGSFLARINNVAANLVDPAGCGETGQVYTDDPMMDRILKRTESTKK